MCTYTHEKILKNTKRIFFKEKACEEVTFSNLKKKILFVFITKLNDIYGMFTWNIPYIKIKRYSDAVSYYNY